MKNYVVSDYQSSDELSTAITSELSESLVLPVSAVHKAHGACEISEITITLNESGITALADINFENGLVRKLAINVLMANKLIDFDEPVKNYLTDFFAECSTIRNEFYEIAYERRAAKVAADREAKELAKEEAKRKATMEKTIREFEVMTKQDRAKLATGEWYYSLGWLAKHCGVITAKLPDYLGNSFENYFGADVPKTLIDTSKKTIGGFAKQWSWEFVCSIKKAKDLEYIPPVIRDATTDITKGIHNTSFVWDLVANYGFQFGKTQDIEKIKAAIPASCLESFEKGFAA